jgi:hypothetical protein
MLYLDKWTWEPEKRAVLQKMSADTKNYKVSHLRSNFNVLGKWYVPDQNVMFLLYEADKPTIQSNDEWLKHAKVESFNVNDARELDAVAKKHGLKTELGFATQLKQKIPAIATRPIQ